MGSYQSQVQQYKALTHSTRLAILDILRDGEQCVCHMEAVLGLRQAHISQHLMVLRDTGLVTDRRDGWNIFYRVVKPEIYQVIDAMNNFSDNPGVNLSAAEFKMHKQTCPCPKCNSEELSSSTKIAMLSPEGVETRI